MWGGGGWLCWTALLETTMRFISVFPCSACHPGRLGVCAPVFFFFLHCSGNVKSLLHRLLLSLGTYDVEKREMFRSFWPESLGQNVVENVEWVGLCSDRVRRLWNKKTL